MNFTLRWPPRAVVLGWLGWLALAAYLCIPPLLWHLDAVRKGSPQVYGIFLAGLLVVGFILPLVWQAIRKNGIWRYELAALIGFLFAGLFFCEPRAATVVVWILAAAYGFGRFCRERLGLPVGSAPGEIAISMGAGLGALVCALFVIGLLKGYYPWILVTLLALPSVLFYRQIRELPAALLAAHNAWARSQEMGGSLLAVVTIFAAAFLACAMMVTLAPCIAFDPLWGHIPAVQYYAARHALVPVPWMPYSYFPQGVEVLMTLAFILGGQPALQILTSSFFGLMLLLAYAAGRECGISRAAAFAGVVFAASLPFLHWTGINCKNDPALAFFQLAALFAYLRWRECRSFNWIRLGVFFLAMSFGVKHISLFGAIPLGLLCLHAAWSETRRFRAISSLAAVLLIFGGFWFVRTYLLTGNPIYPAGWHTTVEVAPAQPDMTRREKIEQYLLSPWRAHFGPNGSFESATPNPMGMALVVLAPLWILLRRKSPSAAERACFFFIAVYLIYWISFWTILRYAIAPLALLLVLAVARLLALGRTSSALLRGSVHLAAAYSLMFALCVILVIEIHVPHFRYFTKQIDKTGYLREGLPTFRALELLKGRAGPNDLVLGVDNCSSAYAPYPSALHCMLSNQQPFSAAGVLRELAGRDYRFLILPVKPAFARIVEAALLRQNARRLFTDGVYSVYRIQKPSGR